MSREGNVFEGTREKEKEERKGEKENLALFVKEKEKEEIQTFLRRRGRENHTSVHTQVM